MKIFNILFISFFLFPKLSVCQSITDEVKIADSLYAQKQYSQALSKYEEIIRTSEKLSPQNLLKVARLHEGFDQTAWSLYYLSLFRKIKNDDQSREKIEDLADKNALEGYEYSDVSFIWNWIKFLKKEIIYSLTILFLVSFFGGVYLLLIKKKSPVISMVLMSVVFIINVVFIQLTKEQEYGILKNENNLVMSGPSAGADLIINASPGHKVAVLDQQDIWTKIIWKDETCYVRSNDLLLFSE